MELIVNERIGNNVEVMEKVSFSSAVDFLEGPGVRNWQFRSSGIKLINIRNLVNDNIKLDNTINFLDENEVEKKYKHFLLEEGDFIIASSGVTWGKIAEVKKEHLPLCLNTSIIKLKAKNNLEKRFLWHFVKSFAFRTQIDKIITGSAQPNFGPSHLLKIQIPLPPLPTQQKIAEILDIADKLRYYNKQLIEKYDALIQSLFLEMFGDPVRNKKGWKVTSIRELCSEVKYGTSEKSIENGTFSYLRMNNITYGGYMDFSNLKYIDIPEKDIHKYLVKKGDVLFNRTNSKELVGKTGLITTDHEYIIAGYLIRIRTNELANPYYIWAHLNSKWSKMTLNNMCKNIVGMANINAQELQDIQILKAPILLQNQFAERVQMIETQKQQAQEALEKSENLFQSLLQKAFKGELV